MEHDGAELRVQPISLLAPPQRWREPSLARAQCGLPQDAQVRAQWRAPRTRSVWWKPCEWGGDASCRMRCARHRFFMQTALFESVTACDIPHIL